MSVLNNSSRTLTKATHTSIKIPSDQIARTSQAHEKARYLRALQLQPGEVAAAQHAAGSQQTDAAIPKHVWDVAAHFEAQPLSAMMPTPAAVAKVGQKPLLALGQAILDYRTTKLGAGTASVSDPASSKASADRTALKNSVSFAAGAVRGFAGAMQMSPIGMLHLERLEMAPAGIERGELLATIPLAPGEQTSVVQKEWSVTNQEFSSIVTDSLENFSEKGVTEKTELADATESQSKHSQQLGLDASVSGSYGFVTFATDAKVSTSVDTQDSVKASAQHAKEVTGKASARVRKERKVTIQTTTEVGQQESTTRTLSNPSAVDAMRIDYYSMMRKWRVRLLQYGLRLTYDVVIPEPGATLRETFMRLSELDALITVPYKFLLKPSEITPDNYTNLADTYGVPAIAPPFKSVVRTFGGKVPEGGEGNHANQIDFDIDDGFEVDTVQIDVFLGGIDGKPPFQLDVLDSHPVWTFKQGPPPTGDQSHTTITNFLRGRTGHQIILYRVWQVGFGTVSFDVAMIPTEQSLAAWRAQLWQSFHDADRELYFANVQAYIAERDQLRAQVADVDTLTLRQEEREEIMKGVLRWLLGPGFSFMPEDVQLWFASNSKSGSPWTGTTGVAFTDSVMDLDATGLSILSQYQETVKFLQEAIEWENLLYICYPYFWDVPTAWDFVRTLVHPDSTRQQFVRSGSARVVLTVRPGFEKAFAAFLDVGDKDAELPADHPYVTVGNEIEAYAQANYPGVPPANPAQESRPLLSPLQRHAWQDIQVIVGLLELYKNGDSARPAHDSYPTTAEGLALVAAWAAAQSPPLATIPATDPWGQPYSYVSPGLRNDYELASLGADGLVGGEGDNADITSWAPASLVAEWFEYTPSHGTDIQINTVLADMA